ncbi:DUF4097 family beta strand repeat-containing protein [Streptomyces sp. NPDC091272]|uniref:DUF4097 family beta strand repeat-containing protein n=1 Tax=Streptomyces sp. NPDC091272 TaxID=3365981 RepID=UPI0038247EE0
MPKARSAEKPHVHRFKTPTPVTAAVSIEVGTVRVLATERTDTVVTVLPGVQDRPADVKAAEQTQVDCANGTLRVRAPRTRALFGKTPSIAVEIEVPAGSLLEGRSSVGEFDCRGRFSEVRVRASVGDIRVGHADTVHLGTGHGSVTADHVEGNAEVTTGSGEIRLGTVGGTGTVKSSNGDIRVDDITGALNLRVANGNVTVGRARSAVTSRTANGGVRLDEVIRGKVTVETSAGNIEVGVRDGSAAWLDVNSTLGRVETDLADADGPGDAGETVEVRARTTIGSITVRRAAGTPPH